MSSQLNRLAVAVAERKAAGKRILDLHSPDSNFAMSTMPADVLRTAMDSYSRGLSYRPDAAGSLRAREAISGFYLKEFEVHVDPDHLILTASTSEAYSWIFRAIPEGPILSERPAYPLFEHLAGFSRRRLDFVDHISTSDSPAAFLTVSPCNPSGAIVRQSIHFIIAETGSLQVFDEVFSSYIWDDSISGRHFPRPVGPSFTLNGASKLLRMPWLKIGWIWLGDHEKSAAFQEDLLMIADTFLSVNGFAQDALPDLLAAGLASLPEYLRALRSNCDFVCSAISKIPGLSAKPPEGGLMLVVPLEEDLGDEEDFAVELLREHGLHVYPGYFYDLRESCMVLSFAQRRETLEESVQILREFVEKKRAKG